MCNPLFLKKSATGRAYTMLCQNIPILPVGILDFCKQKLLAPPMKSHEPREERLSNLGHEFAEEEGEREGEGEVEQI